MTVSRYCRVGTNRKKKAKLLIKEYLKKIPVIHEILFYRSVTKRRRSWIKPENGFKVGFVFWEIARFS